MNATSSSHPRHDLDEVIHAPVRLSIVAALADADRIQFQLLRDAIEVSDSLLSKHIAALEKVGYIQVIKAHVGKRPRTWCRLTETGRTAYQHYLKTLHLITEQREHSGGPP
jgi:DNA-binding HxlR family transcriptional regulator